MKLLLTTFVILTFYGCTNLESRQDANTTTNKEDVDSFSIEHFKRNDFLKRLADDSGKDEINLGAIQIEPIPQKLFEEIQVKVIKMDCITQPCLETLPKEIEKLENLEEIHLGKTTLKFLPDNICRLKKLRILNIYGSSLRTLPNCVGELENLEKVVLWSYKMTSLPSSISKLKRLRKLDLRDSNFSSEEMDRIRNNLPNCDIRFAY